MNQKPATQQEKDLIEAAAKRLRTTIVAIVFGMLCGVGLFTATIWLLIRGGPDVGQMLGRLGHYFPGYDVTWWGSLVGFIYGFLFGAAVGFSTAWVYNLVAQLRSSSRKSDGYEGI